MCATTLPKIRDAGVSACPHTGVTTKFLSFWDGGDSFTSVAQRGGAFKSFSASHKVHTLPLHVVCTLLCLSGVALVCHCRSFLLETILSKGPCPRAIDAVMHAVSWGDRDILRSTLQVGPHLTSLDLTLPDLT
jgi:hypothetical protein